MKIRENVPIAGLTTMRLGGPARFVVSVRRPEEVAEAYQFAEEQGLPTWALGGGANTIGRDEGFPGVVILNELKGVEIVREVGDAVQVKWMGGEVWDDAVAWACERGYTGIEALSLIPGTVGAAPVQNIGAYGQEVGQVLVSVEAYDRRERRMCVLRRDEMGLGYRRTRFNTGADAGRFYIVSVTLKLKRGQMQPPFYNSLQRYIDEHQETDLSPTGVRRMVCAIREAKLPDPRKEASAGSFFKNVIVPAEQVTEMEARGIPVRRLEDGRGKINSGWLIEACGLKGQRLHGFRVSEQAALVLINESATSYLELTMARAEIVGTVEAKFGVRLEQEPVEMIA